MVKTHVNHHVVYKTVLADHVKLHLDDVKFESELKNFMNNVSFLLHPSYSCLLGREEF